MSPSIEEQSYDVVVIGAGPGGATCAALVAEAGHSVLLLDKGAAGDFKIGESLMPETYWTFERLGLLEKLRHSHFPKKYSVQFFSKGGKASAPFYFFDKNEHESSQTWQVLRSEFDAMLLEAARQRGVECHHDVAVTEIVLEGERAVGVRARDAGGEPRQIGARVVVDASGQRSVLARQLGIRKINPDLKHASVFSHFRGAFRDQGVDEGATLILHTNDAEAWFWYIPLPDDVVSVGVVGPVDKLIRDRTGSPQEIFEEEIANCPEIACRVSGAEQLREATVLRDFSYSAERAAGDGWVLVGDAYSFIDPVYSSGVLLALRSGEMAADAIVDSLRSGDLSGESLGRFEGELTAGMASIRRLVHAFYRKDFSFGRFLSRHPEHQGAIVDILVGRVFDRDFDRLFEDMEAMQGEGAAVARDVAAVR